MEDLIPFLLEPLCKESWLLLLLGLLACSSRELGVEEGEEQQSLRLFQATANPGPSHSRKFPLHKASNEWFESQRVLHSPLPVLLTQCGVTQLLQPQRPGRGRGGSLAFDGGFVLSAFIPSCG